MIDKVKFETCTLCKACSNACPVDAISFKNEYLDFEYPLINYDKCIMCNKCENVCTALSMHESKSIKVAYAAKNKDETVRLNSTSGGMFIELAKYVLKSNGYVCGAIFDDDFSVKHIVSNSFAEVEKMSGSKYSQSDVGTVYREIKDLLNSGKLVLFTGSPCQTEGLILFLGKEYENLISVDFICHGITSRKLLKAYVSLKSKHFKSNITDIHFRSKDLGWHNSSVKFEFENGKTYREPITIDYYYSELFLSNILLKECCYKCPSRNFKSKSDITLGDFWGAEVELPNYDDNKGISAVIINTPKGQKIFSEIENSIQKERVNIDTIVNYNKSILYSPNPSSKRKEFYLSSNTIGYEETLKKYYKKTMKNRLKKKIMFFLRKVKNLLLYKEKTLY